MSIRKGSTAIVDRYKGSQLVEKVYKGGDLIFEAFSEITGNLPLSFNSRAAGALNNYRIYGTSAGAGVDTGNLYNIDAKDTNNGFVASKYLNRDGSYTDANNYLVSEYMPVDAGVEYTCIMGTFTNPSLCYYDDQKNYISGFSINAKPRFTTAPTGAKFVRISVRTTNASFTCFVPGRITDPDYYVPYGYKIPLSISDGTNASNYDLFIGSTKLGEEEYVDFGEQKVYKRTDNEFNYRSTDLTGYPNTSIGANTDYWTASGSGTVYKYPLEPNTDYCFFTSLAGTTAGIYRVALTEATQPPTSGSRRAAPWQYTGQDFSNVLFNSGSNTFILFQVATTFDIDTFLKSIALIKTNAIPASFIPYLQPTDPPTPLPAINAYQGENTISSTETVGNVTIKGRISEISPTP